ncbi:hypothetical protein L5515_018311 [Caenorhabditis briggsae]|uniref:Uncharacterized protein n=1 Tax=Caenorhabditis briggsae TaxID=6238 RepID=A0AAE9JSG8_CAEBR|nr:hypothetical protein L5515_018311 [Caenorhabditis briggsae]
MAFLGGWQEVPLLLSDILDLEKDLRKFSDLSCRCSNFFPKISVLISITVCGVFSTVTSFILDKKPVINGVLVSTVGDLDFKKFFVLTTS